jgi:hypothetical protein
MMDWQVYGPGGNGDVAMGPEMFMVIAVIIILMQLRTRRVRLWSICIMPVILILVTAPIIAMEYSGLSTLLFSAAGLAIGCVLGAVIGSHMKMMTDENGRILLKGSMIAILIWIAVLGVKVFGKGLIGDMGIISLDDLTAALLAMTLGALMCCSSISS